MDIKTYQTELFNRTKNLGEMSAYLKFYSIVTQMRASAGSQEIAQTLDRLVEQIAILMNEIK